MSLREMAGTEKERKNKNYKIIRRESDQLKERLSGMEIERKALFDKLKVHEIQK